MHWSRLVDIPIAAVILIARPFVGQHGAETAALIVVPLLTLGIAMLLVHRIAYKLMGTPAALLAVLATPASLGAMKQMRIMRIDHHGWQIVLALVGDARRARRAPAPIGNRRRRRDGAVVQHLDRSAAVRRRARRLVRLPVARAIAAAGERLKSYLAALAGASLLLFGVTHAPSTWLSHPHDVLNVAHLAGFTVAALAAISRSRRRSSTSGSGSRGLPAFGVAAVAAMFAVDPHFLRGPSRRSIRWSRRIGTRASTRACRCGGWRGAMSRAGFAQPLVGLLGALVAIRMTAGEQRNGWIASPTCSAR